MLGMRILVSCCVVPLLIALFWLDAQSGSAAFILLGFCCAVSLRCSFELKQLLHVRRMQPSFAMTALLSVLVVLAGWLIPLTELQGQEYQLLSSLGCIAMAVFLAFAVILLSECVRYTEPGQSMESVGASLLTVLYAGGLLAVTAQFRWFPGEQTAYYALASVIICVKSGDTGAYTLGRLFGKRKLAPRLSPGKTWMGGVGALLGSLLGGMLWLYLGGRLFEGSPQPQSALNAAAFCLAMGVIGLWGDLCESLIKRDCGKKDSAALMPGFGGMLDLVDSPLFAGPFALAWWYLLPLI